MYFLRFIKYIYVYRVHLALAWSSAVSRYWYNPA
eukprot:SAG11_NODE_19036_length_475_cov_1.507979_1_plen_33_part_10